MLHQPMIEHRERIGRKPVHRVIGGGEEADAMGDLAKPSDDQPLGRLCIEIGRDPGGVVLDRVEVVVIGEIAHLDIRMVDNAGEMHGLGVRLAVQIGQGMTPRGVEKGCRHG
ncbi:hypothetical protein STA1M1_23920 [Sinisalibacter aestuarii]|uniref:Uncharacterized protein n=1 Tax=Sinisalibacter aestuarii TaxID=2949426 RepID=A0ABQ5LU69_9RHOB|nr:hypothetical protein STA1M1_23920 [Sinisalibacter aestuarii]